MGVTPWLLLLLGFVLIAGNAIFVAAETALVTVDRNEVQQAAAAGDRRAQRVDSALKQLSTQLSGAQLGITVTSLAIGLVAEPSAARLLAPPLESIGVPKGLVEGVAIALALVLASVVQMVLGELVPKNLSLARPLATATYVIRAQAGFAELARPLIRVLNGAANAILRRMGVEPTEELRSARTPDELSALVRLSADTGVLSTQTAEILVRSLTFSDKRAADVMTPRTSVSFLRASDSVADLLTATGSTGHSRFPVLGEDADDVVGLVHVKQAMAVPHAVRRKTKLRELMVEPVVVPSTLPLDPLLELLRSRGLQMAVVLDEYGGTDGVVTFEDLVEELVGNVMDEHDESDVQVHANTDGTYVLSGLLRPDEVGTLTGVRVPEGDYETIAGLVLERLGRMPELGDVVDLAQCTLTVEQLDVRRIDLIRLSPHLSTEDDVQ